MHVAGDHPQGSHDDSTGADPGPGIGHGSGTGHGSGADTGSDVGDGADSGADAGGTEQGSGAEHRPGGGAGHPPLTVAIDVGGTGLKAAVLDAQGTMVSDRVKVSTTYPCPPKKLLDDLADLVGRLPRFERASAGFPGMVRSGVVLSAPHFVTVAGPGSEVDKELSRAWDHFPLADELAKLLEVPTKVANDADVQGAAVVAGSGLEMVITLGTGVGTALFFEGRLLPHLEFAHFPFRKGDTFNEQLGERVRARIGDDKWAKRVAKAVERFRGLTFFDHCYIGGGNAQRLSKSLGDDVSIVDNRAGILGGIKLWENGHVGV